MPSKSNKRVKNSPGLRLEDETKSCDTPKTHMLTLETLGRKGFLTFPPELVYMIFSYYAEIRIEDILVNPIFLPGHFLDRFKVLRSLSQLCQLSRKIYLPLLYERLQICITTKPAWYREHGNNLIRKCNGLLKSQHLWPYIRTITVCFTRFETNRVLPLFVQLLKALPNVRTLEVPHAHGWMTSIFKRHFEGNIFPTIQKVVMPTCAHEILRCCPGIRDVTCNEGDGGTLVSAVVSTGGSNLEAMSAIVTGPVHMKRLLKANPPLKRVRLAFGMKNPENLIQSFSKFPTLRTIEIESANGDVDDIVKVASDTLRACAEYPVGGSKKEQSRKEAAITHPSFSNSNDSEVSSEERVVRVFLYDRPWLPCSLRERWTEEGVARFVPVEIKEFLVS
ncbi:hypothetical protein B0J17DRAFT_608601 [Rhizoctonia solani]|nr:hypothetical protein B0J17DRAFT_608601 [Rhizoctonia solani]